ncbi:PREDICTED: probable protein phosphatase 2C T23F11.1 [Polistes dominula]|uniref:protein-serine/threonine phosphatase n=1 Tax=Polistes dominula TaxID=743375 RepID=A0ABM1HVD7_POLDO|nr:PREDICTED: probable protein phosphatase 2C T23F11.1 [Polistes dominula]
MGRTLLQPVTTKKSESCQNYNYYVGSSCMQGWRIKMEDCHVHILSLPDDPDTAFFAVYDGHGGTTVAKSAEKYLHELIVKRCEYKAGNIVLGIQNGFLQLDNEMKINYVFNEFLSGSTVIALLIKDNILYCANAGDSRAVASINGKVIALSQDHKPTLEDERKRIENAGGCIKFNRVNGSLALSRALGDFKFKNNWYLPAKDQMVTALPEVKQFLLTEEWEFVVLACDGIWEVMTNEEVVNFIKSRLTSSTVVENEMEGVMNPKEICEELINCCLAPDISRGAGCDNMTVILVCFLHGKSYAHLISRCQKSSTNS